MLFHHRLFSSLCFFSPFVLFLYLFKQLVDKEFSSKLKSEMQKKIQQIEENNFSKNKTKQFSVRREDGFFVKVSLSHFVAAPGDNIEIGFIFFLSFFVFFFFVFYLRLICFSVLVFLTQSWTSQKLSSLAKSSLSHSERQSLS